jgi:hypothetical protein
MLSRCFKSSVGSRATRRVSSTPSPRQRPMSSAPCALMPRPHWSLAYSTRAIRSAARCAHRCCLTPTERLSGTPIQFAVARSPWSRCVSPEKRSFHPRPRLSQGRYRPVAATLVLNPRAFRQRTCAPEAAFGQVPANRVAAARAAETTPRRLRRSRTVTPRLLSGERLGPDHVERQLGDAGRR